jgi:hypothetical protein
MFIYPHQIFTHFLCQSIMLLLPEWISEVFRSSWNKASGLLSALNEQSLLWMSITSTNKAITCLNLNKKRSKNKHNLKLSMIILRYSSLEYQVIFWNRYLNIESDRILFLFLAFECSGKSLKSPNNLSHKFIKKLILQ